MFSKTTSISVSKLKIAQITKHNYEIISKKLEDTFQNLAETTLQLYCENQLHYFRIQPR